MSGTLSSLIRQLQKEGRTIYAAPVSERVATPGKYDETGSESSPSLHRYVEKQAAKKLGDDLGVDPDDLKGVDDFKDLNDLLNDDKKKPKPKPDYPTPPIPVPPLPPEVTVPPTPPVEPPPATAGLIVYVLHDGSVSYSDDGGASFTPYDAISDPIGWAVTGHGVYIANSGAAYFSANLDSWALLTVPAYEETTPLGDFQNGSFESGLSGWETVSGYEPRTGLSSWPILPTDGDAYLFRDWVTPWGSGDFAIEQHVTVDASELTAMDHGAMFRVSADMWTENGATAEISLVAPSGYYTLNGTTFGGAVASSGAITSWSFSGSGGAPDGAGTLRFTYSFANIGASSTIEKCEVQVYLDVGDETFTHQKIVQSNVSSAASNLLGGYVQHALILELSGGTGSYQIIIPAGWKHPISAAPNTGGAVSSADETMDVTVVASEVPLGSVSRSGRIWETESFISSLAGLTGDATSITIKVSGSGSPADVFVDNIRMELVVSTDAALELDAFGGGATGGFAAAGGALYQCSPSALTRVRGLSMTPDHIDATGSYISEGIHIAQVGGSQVSLPAGVRRLYQGAALLENGEVYSLDGSPLYTGETAMIDILPDNGGWWVLQDAGDYVVVKATRDWSTFHSTPLAMIHGNRLAKMGQLLVVYTEGDGVFAYLTSAGWWRAALPSGILEIA